VGLHNPDPVFVIVDFFVMMGQQGVNSALRLAQVVADRPQRLNG